ncbi:MAG: glutamate--tRNA ligase [Spirochaetia bacterium]|nr:glutamate--tRNA ligase [Spirochaetota bacterium]MCX8097012.1 glutamate--tRNA ligase [Spirochaetota bacterium]MDW8111905.1 glutamate--tRNA ligase [Spirochaetia bacterium]
MVRLRFAPSPTGYLHLGNVRTAIFNYLYAKKHNGSFILRIEDTDLQRSEERFVEAIKKDLEWLGLQWDELYFQSHRFEIYREYAEKLVSIGRAYYCTCTREEIENRLKDNPNSKFGLKYDRHCRGRREKPSGNYVMRFDIGDFERVEYEDVVKGEVKVPFSDLDDFIIIKGDGTPTYNFAVVIDDYLMNITHVIRGEDHITNTAKQLLIYEALGLKAPIFAHLPLILNSNKSPLSKREGSITIEHYRKEGYIPEGIINYLSRLGWSYGDREIFTIEELINLFDIQNLNKSNAIFDDQKMLWVNSEQIRMLTPEKFLKYYTIFIKENALEEELSEDFLVKAFEVYKTRINTLKDFYYETRVYVGDDIEIDKEFNIESMIDETVIKCFRDFVKNLDTIISSPDEESDRILREIPERYGIKLKQFGPPLRIALTSRKVSPGLVPVIKLLGKEKTLARVQKFLK